MTDSATREHQVVSRIIDYLDETREKIVRYRCCWKDGREEYNDDLIGKLDTEFSQTRYNAGFEFEEINFHYCINWGNEIDSWFSIMFSELTRIGLRPNPKDIAVFLNNPKNKFNSETNPPIFQACYEWRDSDARNSANIAMQDFADNGEKLEKYFVGMQQESVREYSNLVNKLKKFRNEDIARI